MKTPVLCLLAVLFGTLGFGQVNGTLTYEDEYHGFRAKGKVITTIYQSGLAARIESVNIREKGDDVDTANSKPQFTLLFDFGKKQKIILNTLAKLAVTTPIDSFATVQLMQQAGSSVSIENLGSEGVGVYNCTHFAIKIKNPKVKNPDAGRKDIWVTKDLGSSNILYAGPYLYYVLGDYLHAKLVDAGAEGVVVKWEVGSDQCMLTGYKKERLPASMFVVPANYSGR